MAAWKTIRITKPCTLRIDNCNLIVEDEEHRFKISLEDTDSIVFEGDRFMLSAKVLSELSRHKIATLFCDEFYMPNAILHPYHQSSVATRILRLQLSAGGEYADELWRCIVRAKIRGQQRVLTILGRDASRLDDYAEKIAPGDRHGAEAKSARWYWSRLFENLVRESKSADIRNQALNYAYALIRSLISRDLSAAGFLPALGIWHKNDYNAFNLSDDLMEPFRPIIDLGVYRILQKHQDKDVLTPDMKKELISLLDIEYLLYENGSSSMRSVSKLYIQQFKRSIVGKDPSLLEFPKFEERHLYERV